MRAESQEIYEDPQGRKTEGRTEKARELPLMAALAVGAGESVRTGTPPYLAKVPDGALGVEPPAPIVTMIA